MRIGIFLPNWVGDVVMATPALRSLRCHLSDRAQLTGIMRPYVSDVLAGTSWLDDTIIYTSKTLRSRVGLVRQIRKASLDVILLMTNSLSTAALARLSGADRRIGFAMHGRGCLLTDRLQLPRTGNEALPRSAVDHYLEIVQVLGCDISEKRIQLGTTAAEESAAAGVWRKFGWSGDDSVVVLNTGGAYGAAKSWPSSHFAQLAYRLAEDRNAAVLVICGPAERTAAEQICRQAAHPRVRNLAAEPLSVGLSKACIRRSRLMITTDSGPRHFAAGFNVPVITIFGPTDPRWSHNYHAHSIDLQLNVDCGPCAERTCPLKHHRCMRDLTPEYLLAQARTVLDTALPKRAA